MAPAPIAQDQRGYPPAAPPTGYFASECNRCGDLHLRVSTSSLSGGATAVLGGSPSTTDRGSGLSQSGRGIPEQLLPVVSPGDSSHRRLYSGPSGGSHVGPVERRRQSGGSPEVQVQKLPSSRTASCPRGVPIRTRNRDWFISVAHLRAAVEIKGPLRQGLWIHPAS